jgi:hypothetical protein
MDARIIVFGGERWIVEEGSPAGIGADESNSYVSETADSYTIVFVHAITREKRQANWHNPLDQCTVEDLQIMLEAARPV